jgi:hypothetical protein
MGVLFERPDCRRLSRHFHTGEPAKMNAKDIGSTDLPVTPPPADYRPVELGVASEVTKGLLVGPYADFANHRYVP